MDSQQPGRAVNLDAMGRQLSIDTNCIVRFDHNTGSFVCKCGVIFPLNELDDNSDWSWVKTKHDKEGR